MKSIKRVLPYILVLAMCILIFGCTNTEQDKGSNYRSGVEENGDNYRITDDSGGTDNGLTRNGAYDYLNPASDDNIDRDTSDNMGNSDSKRQFGDEDTINMIEDLCTKQDNVEDASAVINDDTCYIGLDLKNDQKITENMKEKLSTEIKRAEPNIRKVYYTEDRNIIEEFIDEATDLGDANWRDLKDMF